MFTFDCHVHFGQYNHIYYQPSYVVKALYKNGIRRAWVSSTTACIAPKSFEEAKYLSRHIENEMQEAAEEATKLKMTIVPLYWAVPKRYCELDKVDGSRFAGFKIHPKVGEWNTYCGSNLFHNICVCASQKNFPILIHTGVDAVDSPYRFEKYFADYPNVTFVLAHCRNVSEVTNLFGKYENLLGDTAFCPLDDYKDICRAGFQPRMLWGTDFPITHWYERTSDKVSLSALFKNYKAVLQRFRQQ